MSEPRLSTACCFSPSSVDGSVVADLIEVESALDLTKVVSADFPHRGRFFPRKHLPQLREQHPVGSLILRGEADSLTVATVAKWDVQMLYVNRASGSFDVAGNQSQMSRLSSAVGFRFASLSDPEDAKWQSETDFDYYRRAGRKVDPSLISTDENGRETVDVSNNPGRWAFFPGMRLEASWRMWFAEYAQQWFPVDRLMAFQGATQIEKLPNGVVFVELFDDPEAPDGAVQQAFRDWMGFEVLEREARDYLGRPRGSASVEIETMENGGRVLRSWESLTGAVVPRDLADRVVERVYDARGKLLSTIKEPLRRSGAGSDGATDRSG